MMRDIFSAASNVKLELTDEEKAFLNYVIKEINLDVDKIRAQLVHVCKGRYPKMPIFAKQFEISGRVVEEQVIMYRAHLEEFPDEDTEKNWRGQEVNDCIDNQLYAIEAQKNRIEILKRLVDQGQRMTPDEQELLLKISALQNTIVALPNVVLPDVVLNETSNRPGFK